MALLSASAVACSAGGAAASISPTSSPGGQTTTSSGYSIAVFLSDKQIYTLTVAELSKLPQVKANISGTEEQGPTLLAALQLAGVTDFTQLTVYGYAKGRLATAQLALTRTQVTNNVMLALVTRGTAKLTGTDIGAQKAIIDVNKIVVTP